MKAWEKAKAKMKVGEKMRASKEVKEGKSEGWREGELRERCNGEGEGERRKRK